MVFNFLQFWKKTETKTGIPISKIPLFSTLGPQELGLIEEKIRLVEFKKRDIVFRIGEEPEGFYVILSGRFRVIGPKGNTLITLSHGDYFGESSILAGRAHSATIEAKNDGLALRIEKNDFLRLLNEIPSLSLHLGKTLGHRLALGPRGREHAETKILSICNYEIDQQTGMFAWNLSAMLVHDGKRRVVLVSLQNRDQNPPAGKPGEAFSLADLAADDFEHFKERIVETKGGFHFLKISNEAGLDGDDKRMASLLALLMEHYDFVLLHLPAVLGEMGVKAIQQSDVIYFLITERNRNSSKARSFLTEFETAFGFTPDKIRLILCEDEEGGPPVFSTAAPGGPASVEVFHILPCEKGLAAGEIDRPPFVLENPDNSYAKAIRFLSREITGSLVGLALGSGAAFGFSHIGVLKILEQEKIPVDVIAGSSIGALVGALWAGGMDAKTIEELAVGLDKKSIFFKLIGLQDFSMPHHGFFKGNQVAHFLRRHLGMRTFRSLQIPLKVATANMFTGEEVIIDEGDVVDAIRASISIPGIFRPVRWQDQYLIDGGVVDPLPVKVLTRYGVKKIIAVNVLSAAEDHLLRREYYEAKKAEMEAVLAKGNIWMKMWLAFRSRVEKRYQPNVFNVLMNTIQFLEYGIAESAASGADILIRPILHNAHWAEFYSAAKFIRKGEEKTLEQLAEIKRLVEEKV